MIPHFDILVTAIKHLQERLYFSNVFLSLYISCYFLKEHDKYSTCSFVQYVINVANKHVKYLRQNSAIVVSRSYRSNS